MNKKIEKIEVDLSYSSFDRGSPGVDFKNAIIGNISIFGAKNEKLRQVIDEFWQVRELFKRIVMVVIFTVAVGHIGVGIWFAEKENAVMDLLAGLGVLLVAIVYLLIWRADQKDGAKDGFKGFWLTLDLLFLGIVFWALL